MKKNAQGMSMNVIIIAALALLILVVLVIIFAGRMGNTQTKKNLTGGGISDQETCAFGDEICNASSSMSAGEKTVCVQEYPSQCTYLCEKQNRTVLSIQPYDIEELLLPPYNCAIIKCDMKTTQFRIIDCSKVIARVPNALGSNNTMYFPAYIYWQTTLTKK